MALHDTEPEDLKNFLQSDDIDVADVKNEWSTAPALPKEQLREAFRLVVDKQTTAVLMEGKANYTREDILDDLMELAEKHGLSERLDEQLSTGTLRYRPDEGGNYGEVFYFIPHEDTVKPQQERIEELEAQLNQKKEQL